MSKDDTLQELGRRAVHKLLQDFNWRLVSEEEFIAMTCARLPEIQHATLAKAVEVAQGIYSELLYQSCRNPKRCELAYEELYQYLYKIAHNRWREIAPIAAQEALVLTYEKINSCHNARTFLRFAQFKLRDAVSRIQRRQRLDQTVSLEEMEERQVYGEFADTTSRLPEEEVLRQDEIKGVRDCLQKIVQSHARAHRQLRALWWKYHYGLGDEEIAQRLETTPGSVRTLRNRGLDKLRKCLERHRI